MSKKLTISFSPLDMPQAPVTAVLAGQDLALGATAKAMDEAADGALGQAAKAASFTGAAKSSIEILAPCGLKIERLIVMGAGKQFDKPADDLTPRDWQDLGGAVYAALTQRKARSACLIAEAPDSSKTTSAMTADDVAMIGLGALLRSYDFDKYKNEKPKSDKAAVPKAKLAKLVILCAEPKAAEKAFKRLEALAAGVFTARDLVNEPANKLGPVEFAKEAMRLEDMGLEVDVLDDKALKSEKMFALLSVGQGSVRPSRVVVMQWRGAKSKKARPICFVGKGVVFDTGGISMKPAGGMEDMKGDMGGAACVVGLMRALAGRKAAVNAVGLIGVTENMPSGDATRPGDIVTSRAGITIEVINTDAEGRLVLADVLDYAQDKFKPKMLIDLATLTGAIIVALGKDRAGMFSNDDELAAQLSAAGDETGEKVWRMPLGASYDKLINSKNADIKNVGGRHAGAITAAQFLQRFIHDNDVDGKDMAWAHLDIAGTAMGSPNSPINRSWGSGWGVQLLDRLVAENYE